MYILFILLSVICVVVFLGTLFTDVTRSNILLASMLLGAVFIIGAAFTYDYKTDQEKCESSGFTWQLTDELVETSDGFVHRGYCIDL